MPLQGNRKWKLRHRYGVDEEGFEFLAKRQNYQCAICGVHQDDLPGSLHVDHCHKTNKVRGLLCLNCNAGLGSFRDSPDLMIRAMGYLDTQGVI